MVDIATTDWPHFYPTFFTDITSWIHGDVTGGSSNANGNNVVVGLSFLLITSEELATPRDNVTSARKEELKRLLATQVPQVSPIKRHLIICTTVLDSTPSRRCQLVKIYFNLYACFMVLSIYCDFEYT